MTTGDYSENIEQTQETAERPHPAPAARVSAVHALVEELSDSLRDLPEGDQVGQIIENAVKLLRDQTNRGDVKLINKAMKELRYALKVFAPYRTTHKVSIFGSARTPQSSPDYKQCADFAKRMVGRGWMVITGAGGGIMAAGHGGAGADPSFGLAIRLPFEQATNTFISRDKKLINFKYFFTRKLMFVRAANAIALFPGGFGTMDEGFEVLTLIQTGKCVPMPLVLVDAPGGTFWRSWGHFVEKELLSRGLISHDDLALFKITDSAETAAREVTHFYSNYHSIRFHRDDLIIRLKHRPSAALLASLERDFSEIKVAGNFHVSGPLPIEANEEDLENLHRLIFTFNRRDQGRLRVLINRLNDSVD